MPRAAPPLKERHFPDLAQLLLLKYEQKRVKPLLQKLILKALIFVGQEMAQIRDPRVKLDRAREKRRVHLAEKRNPPL